MPTKAELDLEIRLTAIEYVIARIGKILFLTAQITPEQMRQMRESGRAKLLQETFPGIDATMADHVGAELADYVDKLLGDIENQVADAYRKLSQRES